MTQSAKKKRKQLRARKREHQETLKQASDEACLRSFLTNLGIAKQIRELKLDRRLLQPLYPRIQVQLAPDVQNSVTTTYMLKEMRKSLEETRITVPGLSKAVPVQDYYRVLLPFVKRIRTAYSANPRVQDVLEAARQCVESLAPEETWKTLLDTVYRRLERTLFAYSRLESTMFCLTIHLDGDAWCRLRLSLQLREHKVPVTSACVDGKTRRAYRVGPPCERTQHDWISWTTEQLGVLATGASIPVFIQQHALDRIFSPHGRFGDIGPYAWIFRESLWESLNRSL